MILAILRKFIELIRRRRGSKLASLAAIAQPRSSARIRAGRQTPGRAAKPLTTVRSVAAFYQVASADRTLGLTISLSMQMQIAS